MTNTVAVIGGSGIYGLPELQEASFEDVRTPFGAPSAAVLRGKLNGVPLLFLARHGKHHSVTPSEINVRANIYALKSLGASFLVGISAVGSLREELRPGDVVIPDQLIDRTRGRDSTFFGQGCVAHISFAEPFCPVVRSALLKVCADLAVKAKFTVHAAGTYVCMEGPAFSTRAESQLYRSWGASLIGMTALPEAKLAREAEIAYGIMAMVTDYDCWKEDEQAVDVSKIIALLSQNAEKAAMILKGVVPVLAGSRPSELAAQALRNALVTRPEHMPEETRERLRPILARYL